MVADLSNRGQLRADGDGELEISFPCIVVIIIIIITNLPRWSGERKRSNSQSFKTRSHRG
jgi:hypothetical protein